MPDIGTDRAPPDAIAHTQPRSSHSRSDHGYRRDIDGLRAIAVLSVVAFHAFPGRLPGGYVGVDVFFVISGYLISGVICGQLARGRFSFADFYARRIKRIIPALLVVLAACYAFGWIALLPTNTSSSANTLLRASVSYRISRCGTKPDISMRRPRRNRCCIC